LDQLGETKQTISIDQLNRYLVAQFPNPLPFPHADVTIFSSTVYAGTKEGLAYSSGVLVPNGDRPRAQTAWDGPVIELAPGYGSLAVAAGTEGLFELSVWGIESPTQRQLARRTYHRRSDVTTSAGWVFLGLYGASRSEATFMRYMPAGKEPYRDASDRELAFEADEREIFGTRGVSWGSGDRFCLYGGGRLRVVRFVHQARIQSSRFKQLASEPFRLSTRLVSAAIALFGVVIESESAVHVLASDGSRHRFSGEPVNWRAFNRSRQYQNQLHVVGDDRLQILAFTHDFSLAQERKIMGTKHEPHRVIDVKLPYVLAGYRRGG
jgi:hypothetical protein